MDLLDLGHERFVALTTFRRDGRAVPTPVWVGRDGDHLVVITPAGSGKTKRLARDPRVTLQPCDRRGRVAPGAPVVEGVAVVRDDPWSVERTRSLLAAKYGLELRAFMLVERLVRRGNPDRVAIEVRPAPAARPGAGTASA